MKLFLFRKRYLAIPGAILAVCALCLVTTLPSYVTTAATQRQLPIYCVQRDHKVVSLSFDAAWGDAILRHIEKRPESFRTLSSSVLLFFRLISLLSAGRLWRTDSTYCNY